MSSVNSRLDDLAKRAVALGSQIETGRIGAERDEVLAQLEAMMRECEQLRAEMDSRASIKH